MRRSAARLARSLRFAAVTGVAAVLTLTGLPGAVERAGAVTAPSDRSTAYQIDPAHDGHLASGIEVPPLARRWSVDLGGNSSYPIIAEGKVFVTSASPGGSGQTIHAIDAKTGGNAWGPIDIGGIYGFAALTYGGGRLFSLDGNGVLRSFDAGTGFAQWTVQLPGQYSFTSPPTYRSGMVFTGGAGTGGTLYGVRATDGHVVWTAPVENGDSSSPAVSAAGVYVSYACEQTYRFDPSGGALRWHHSTACSGGGGRTPVLGAGRLWVRDDAGASPAVLDAETGGLLATYGATVAPAFDGSRGFFLNGNVLTARDRNQMPLWSFTGDGQLVTAPIVVNGYVYVGSATGHVWAIDEATGASVWDDDAGAPIYAPDEHNAKLLTGLGAGEGLVVVPTSRLLVAYGSATTAVAAKAWGWNARGQLGNGSTSDHPVPGAVPGIPGALAVTGGTLHSLALASDGALWAWGWNGVGQLGDGTTTDHPAAIKVPGLTGVRAISGGAYHSLAAESDGSVWAWGWNPVGQLGDGTTLDRHAPVRVVGLDHVVDVAGGTYHSLALRADGTVWAWGWNGYGDLGDGTTTDHFTPVQVVGLSNVVAIAAGAYHSLAVKADGTVWAWGWNGVGQLGDATTITRASPVQVGNGLTGVTAVSAGILHSLAVGADGRVRAWGWNGLGELGDGTTNDHHLPIVVPGLSGVVGVAGGAYHSVALDLDGRVSTWGWNGVGQLGTGSTDDRLSPGPVAGAGPALVIGVGAFHTLT
jgi:alpha-tubulin suppressor-like RCC1 family protein/outer membrane protein assembly factor BamB